MYTTNTTQPESRAPLSAYPSSTSPSLFFNFPGNMYGTEKQGEALRVQLFHRLSAAGEKSSSRRRVERVSEWARERTPGSETRAICWKCRFYIPSRALLVWV